MGRHQDELDSDLAVEDQVATPRLYKVILLNDDYTPMEFVIEVLRRFFQKSETEAHDIMLQIHHQGSGIAGVYQYDIAESKVTQVNQFSRTHHHPLKTVMSPENE
ncbi:MAG: ATP-dependent Clp protease adapter ClpS [Bdellovibrionales bacterium]|nr:ATP-dependent Clp protease adapter ClpS [Bdellovibrionales bacterium]